MRTRSRIIGLCLAGAVLIWVFDAGLDSLLFQQGSFVELLITAVPGHEVYDRTVSVLLFLILGLIVARITAGRRSAQLALRESEQRYRELVDRMSSGVAVYRAVDDGLDFEFVDFNTAAQRIEHMPKAKVIGRRVTEVFPRIREFGLLSVLDRVWRTGVPEHYPVTLYHDDKREGWRENFVYRLPSSEVVAIYDDITQRRQAEEGLRRAEHRWRSIFHAIGQPAVILDPEHGIVAANRAVSELAGRSEKELLGKKCYEVFHSPDDKCPANECPMEKMLTSNEGKTVEMEMEAFDGVFLVSCTPVRDADGKVDQVIHIATDITEQRRATETLREREATLKAIFRAAPTGIGLTNNRVIESVNERLCKMTGYDRQELLGNNARLLYATDDEYEFVGRETTTQVRACGTGTVETKWRCKDNTIIDVLLSSTPLDPDNLSAGLTFTALDITARRQAEESHHKLEAQLRHSQKMEAVGQLAGGVAHDFNNILTAIIGNVELALGELEGKLPPGALALEGMHQIEHSAHRAATLTRQLLAFSRRQVAQPRILHLGRALSDIEKMLCRLLSEDVDLRICSASDLKSVCVDPGHLDQVIVNLVVNSRDAMPDGGILTIEASNVVLDSVQCATHPGLVPGPYVRLAVSDTGHGMDKATLERVFEPFFTTKSETGGTGLGLATVYGIIKQAGGHIAAYSEPGRGTTFRIDLPAADEPAVEPEEIAAIPDAKLMGIETILLCEDDLAVRELTAHVLRGAGYTVIAASHGAAAIREAQAPLDTLDLLITDVIMPDMNGRRLAEYIERLRPGVRTLFVSGYTSNVIVHHGVLDDDVEFLEKPFNRIDLLRRVRNLLDQSRPIST